MSTNKDNSVKPEKKEVQEVIIEATDQEKAFIDEYFNNGFNRLKAANTVNLGKTYHTIDVWARRALNKPAVKKYLKDKSSALRAETQIEHVMILKELLSFAYSNVTTFVGLSPEQIKDLPSEITRCISSLDIVTKSWIDPSDKSIVKEVTVKFKLIDKLKAIEMISRHIDFFNADNASKSGTIDLTKATNEDLNAVLRLIKEQTDNS